MSWKPHCRLVQRCQCYLLRRDYQNHAHAISAWSLMRQYCTEDRRKGFPRTTKESKESATDFFLSLFKFPSLVSTDFMASLHRRPDFHIDTLKRWWKRKKDEARLFDQRFIPERHQILGPDLASAHFIVCRKGAVKFLGSEEWVVLNEKGEHHLPSRYVPNMYLEGIDASGLELLYEGFANLDNLRYLKSLKLRNCPYIDDWCLDRLNRYRLHLEHLDISGCPQITDCGLPVLYRLRKLKTLHMENLSGVNHLPLIALLLQEALPDCKFYGVEGLDHHLDTSDRSTFNTRNETLLGRAQKDGDSRMN